MFYRQRDIIQYNVKLNDGTLFPMFGLILNDDSTLRYSGNKVYIFRVSKCTEAFNPDCHRMLNDSELSYPFDSPAYVTTGIEDLDATNSVVNIQVINRMSQREFDNTLAWATTLIGHKFLWVTNPIRRY